MEHRVRQRDIVSPYYVIGVYVLIMLFGQHGHPFTDSVPEVFFSDDETQNSEIWFARSGSSVFLS